MGLYNPNNEDASKMKMIPKMKTTSKIKMTPKNEDNLKNEGNLSFLKAVANYSNPKLIEITFYFVDLIPTVLMCRMISGQIIT